VHDFCTCTHSGLDPFAHRQFDDPSYAGTRISFDKDEFVKIVNEEFAKDGKLADGYADL